jgi:hypothetical protein
VSIDATVSTSPISATVSPAGTVQAAVSSSSAAIAGVSGGVGPQGPAGNAGPLTDVSDVAVSSLAAGDVLRYSNAKWRNFPEADLTVDGGNF